MQLSNPCQSLEKNLWIFGQEGMMYMSHTYTEKIRPPWWIKQNQTIIFKPRTISTNSNSWTEHHAWTQCQWGGVEHFLFKFPNKINYETHSFKDTLELKNEQLHRTAKFFTLTTACKGKVRWCAQGNKRTNWQKFRDKLMKYFWLTSICCLFLYFSRESTI